MSKLRIRISNFFVCIASSKISLSKFLRKYIFFLLIKIFSIFASAISNGAGVLYCL